MSDTVELGDDIVVLPSASGVEDAVETIAKAPAERIVGRRLKSAIPVHCGSSAVGLLHRERFVCPGIHAPCIQVKEGLLPAASNNKLLTPKQFTQLGNAGLNAEWRRVIYSKDKTLRELMDSDRIGFYDHINTCSGMCTMPLEQVTTSSQSEANDDSRGSTTPEVVDVATGAIGARFQKRKMITVPEIEVTCQNLSGTMVMSEFRCPGLRHYCIKLDDGKLLTPKEFVLLGNGGKYAEWRRLIKYSGVSLRQYMDRKQLDFYKHDKLCTGLCTSTKPPVASVSDTMAIYENDKDEKYIFLQCGSYVSCKMYLHLFTCPGVNAPCVEFENKWITPKELTTVAYGYPHPDWRRAIKNDGLSIRTRMDRGDLEYYEHTRYCTGRCSRVADTDKSTDTVAKNTVDAASSGDDSPSTPTEVVPMFKDPVRFWRSMTKLGLCDRLINDLHRKLAQSKAVLADPSAKAANVEMVCKQLSSVVDALDMTPEVMEKIKAHQSINKNSAQVLDGELKLLKQMEKEQERLRIAAEQKQKLFDQLLHEKPEEPPAPKVPKLETPESGQSSVFDREEWWHEFDKS